MCRKAHELIHEEESRAAGVQLIKRFSGGGTVVVDQNTLFATFIMEGSAFPEIESYPRAIMRWSREFYNPIFLPYGDFSLQEHGMAVFFFFSTYALQSNEGLKLVLIILIEEWLFLPFLLSSLQISNYACNAKAVED